MEYFTAEFGVSRRCVAAAVKSAYRSYNEYLEAVRDEGQRVIKWAREHKKPIIVLAGRPYHIDPEINHGIDELIGNFGICAVSEDSIAHLAEPQKARVLNQWTYHARLYGAARYVCTQPDMQLVQLVSFGCGLDAVTGDETREILESHGKLYTQLKIDEIYNLGAVKIRIRSLLAADKQKQKA